MKLILPPGALVIVVIFTLLIWGIQGSLAEGSDSVTVTGYILPHENLDANFTATPVSGTAPLTVRFTDTSTGNPTAWRWDFTSDGTTDSFAKNPSYTYTRAGTYSVKLRVTGQPGSDTETKTAFITVTSSGAEEKLTALNSYVDRLRVSGWSKWMLVSSLRSAGHELDDGNERMAINHLRSFIQEVRWIRWFHVISQSQADYMTGEAEAIISFIR
jgi:PKD repeat protein